MRLPIRRSGGRGRHDSLLGDLRGSEEQGVDPPMARFVARTSLVTGAASVLAFGTTSLLYWSWHALIVTGVAALVTGSAWWQIHTAAYRTAPVQYSIIFALWVALFFVPPPIADSFAFAIIAATLVGGLLVEERSINRFFFVATTGYATHISLELSSLGSAADVAFIIRHAIDVIVLVAGFATVTVVRRGTTRARRRYEHLFSRAPVALLEQNLSGIGPMFDALRAQGVDNLDVFFEESPQELRRMINVTRLTRVNPAAVEMFGAREQQDLRAVVRHVVLGEDAVDTLREQFISLWSGQTAGYRVAQAIRIDGTNFAATLNWSVEDLPRETRFARVLIAMTDISAIRAETDARLRAESEYRALTDSTASAIVSVGSNGLIRTWNRAAETVFGYTQEEVAGSPLTMLMPERFRKDHTAALARVSAGGERRILGPAELVALRKDGTEFPIELSLGAWEWNGDLMHTGVITDIADRVAAREELESSHAVLSNLLESKDRLIAAVSHELRTPLTSIYGYARLLADEADSLPPEQRAEFHRVIAEQSSDVSGIIEDLLVASRTGSEAIRVSASPVNLAEIVREVIERQGFDEKVQIEIAGQAAALVDRLRLRQIIRNLLANVVRHWGMKCRVNIRRNTHTSIVEVSDNGDGAPEQSVEHIFEAFHTAGTREKTPVDSIGIGLSVSRRLARLMGGDLTYRRDAGWTRFELEVPAFGATPAETGQTPPVKNSTRQSGFVLEVGMPVGLTTTVDEGRAAMGCGGPGSGTCPLVEGDGCALASSAAAIVFHLDLDDAYNRDILRCYREGLGPDIPIEVHIKAGDEITYAEDLVGTTTVIEAADPPPDKSGSRTESSRAPQVAGTDHQEPVHAAFDENGSRLRVGVDPSP